MKLDISKLNKPITVAGKKPTYPTKRTMNLYYKTDRTTKSATIALYVLFALVLLLFLVKLLVFDILIDMGEKKDQLKEKQNELQAYQDRLKDYDKVLLEYERYASTPDEEGTDRMELLYLVDSAVRTTAKVDSIEVRGEQMLLQFSGVTLSQIADIVQQLEASPLVDSTHVSTASTTNDGQDIVRASVLIQLTAGVPHSQGNGEGGAQQ